MKHSKDISHSSNTHKSPSLPRYAYIDALRGVAIIGVLFAHVSHYSNVVYPSWIQSIATINVGPRGVQLFYIVSAVTLCMSFSKRKQREKHPIRNFYTRRFFRIAPLFYLAILYYLWQENYWNGNPSHFSLMNIFTTFTFLNGVSSDWMNNIVFGGWSIAVETTFYLLFPLLFYKLKNFRISLIITFIVGILMQLLRVYLLTLPLVAKNPDVQTYTFEFFPSQLPVFLIGMSVFFMMHEETVKRYKKQILILISTIILLMIAQNFLLLKLIAGHYLYGIIFGVLLFLLSERPYKILVNPLTVFIGKISFSLYLCHMAVYYWLTQYGLSHYLPENPLWNFSLRFLILSIFSVAVSTILFYTVEKYGIIIGKKLINKYEKPSESYIESNVRTW